MTARQQVDDLLAFIDASPSPFHAVQCVEQRLCAFNFKPLLETEKWSLEMGGRYYVVRDDSSIICFIVGHQPLAESGFKILGAHTDSPGFRVKPNPLCCDQGMVRLGVEVYGSPLLATFTDRDLSLAGRIVYKAENGALARQLVHIEQPLLRLPNLAIHMNRRVNEEGLKLDKQNELPLLMSSSIAQQIEPGYLHYLLQQASGVDAQQVVSWDLAVYDTQKGVFWGDCEQFYADSQLDNLASCHAGLQAMLHDTVLEAHHTVVCAFFDHEEVGSESYKGADGGFLTDVLRRIAFAGAMNDEDYQRVLAHSFMISADMAHAYQPNFPSAYEPQHRVFVNQGPVIKKNANQRYSSESVSEAMFISWCQEVGVPWQSYCHRTDIPCGSTIGPMSSARLGVRCVDVGNALWAMHSVRESAGVEDHGFLISVLQHFFSRPKSG